MRFGALEPWRGVGESHGDALTRAQAGRVGHRVRDTGAMYWRLVEMAIEKMDPRQFEDLVYALVVVEHPNARQLKPPDMGRDTVVDLGDGTELVWQAKHHASGISWSKCEESLVRALGARKPREVTFVFPVAMTEGKEAGLEDLRRRYPQVELPEPWTLPTLRSLLAKADDVRRELIDRPIGIDVLHVQAMLERAAERDRKADQASAAAMAGPLAALGHSDALDEARGLEAAGDWHESSLRYEALADLSSGDMPRVGNSLLLQAARLAAEDQDRSRAGDLYLRASSNAARQGSDVAEFAAFRASWLLPEDDRWRSHAAMARASWPERPEDAVPVLRDSFERALASKAAPDVLEWTVALCDALAADDDWAGIVEAAERAVGVVGAIALRGDRLELELEWLAARGELGQDTTTEWRELLLKPVGRDGQHGALIRARFGQALARAGRGAEAAEQFAVAAGRWQQVGDAEDEIAEAVLSEDVVAQALGAGRRLDQSGRIAVADLRGRRVTSAVTAERLATQGTRAWMAQRGWEARARLVTAWSIHRRAGHLAGCMRVAEALHDLFKAGALWEEALPWAIRCGLQLASETAATHAGWPAVSRHVRATASSWEQGPIWETIAAAGQTASDDEIKELVPPLLAAAAEHETSERVVVQASAAARRALAAVLCGVNADLRDQAVKEVEYESVSTPFPPRRTVHGLMLATDLGVCDASALIAELYGFTDRAHLGGFGLALDIVRASPEAQAKAIELSADQFPALLLCAWTDLPDRHRGVADRSCDVITRSLDGQLQGHEILRPDDRGRLAKWASDDARRTVAKDLVGELTSPAEIGVHRYEAAVGLASLADRIDAVAARELLDELFDARHLIAEASTTESMSSHPNALFARVHMTTPAAADHVRAAALTVMAALAVRGGDDTRLRELVSSGLADPVGLVRAEAIRHGSHLDEQQIREHIGDEDATVRLSVLQSLSTRKYLSEDDDALVRAAAPSEPLASRSAAGGIVRDERGRHPRATAALLRDPHVYVRAVARAASGSPGGP